MSAQQPPPRFATRVVPLAGLRGYRWPTMLALVTSTAAAAVLLFGRPSMSSWAALCLSSKSESGLLASTLRAAWLTGVMREAAVDWLLMTLVMVPPLNLSLIRFVAVRSFVTRRACAVAEFLVSLLIVWALLGVVMTPLVVLSAVLLPSHDLAAALAFGLAALWQMTPMKRSALLRCHRTKALTASGWRADRDCLLFGLSAGEPCVSSCAPMMFACALMPHSIAGFAAIQTISMHERAAHAPKLARYALLLAGCAAALTLTHVGRL